MNIPSTVASALIFQIFAQIDLHSFRQARRVQHVAKNWGRQAAGELQSAGQRSMRVAQQGEANFVPQRPFRVVADRLDEAGSGSGAVQGFDDSSLGEAGIFERGLPDAGLFVEQQRCRYHPGTSAGERDAFAETDRGETGDEQFLSDTLQVGSDRGE